MCVTQGIAESVDVMQKVYNEVKMFGMILYFCFPKLSNAGASI